MSHLNEGLLTELIDNELSETERRSAEAHLAECGECRRILEELKAFATEADGLVAAVEVPVRTAAKALPIPPSASTDQPRWGIHRWRTYAWAASVLLALGLGWAASDLRYAAPGEQGLLLEEKERAGSAPSSSDAPSAPAPEPVPSTTASTNSASPAQTPRNRAGGGPADAFRDEKAAPAAVAAEQSLRSDAERRNIPSRPSSQPQAAAKLAQDAAGEMDSLGSATFGNASVAANPPAAAAPEPRVMGGLMARQAVSGFRQVRMEEAVRTLGGSIRLMDGLEARRILIGPGSEAGADPTLDLVRVVYEDPPGRELWLDQRRPSTNERKRGAATLLPGDTLMSRDGSGPLTLRWIDESGFWLALTGYLATDSLRAMIHRVH